jgi:hypothetical protein
MPRNFSHSAFEHFDNEARTRIAFAFIPDPGADVSVPQLSELIGKPPTSLNDGASKLLHQGLLEQGDPTESGVRTYRRVGHPIWAVYETARLVFTELGIEVRSLAPSPEIEL